MGWGGETTHRALLCPCQNIMVFMNASLVCSTACRYGVQIILACVNWSHSTDGSLKRITANKLSYHIIAYVHYITVSKETHLPLNCILNDTTLHCTVVYTASEYVLRSMYCSSPPVRVGHPLFHLRYAIITMLLGHAIPRRTYCT